jgi:hypothetical protein
MILVGVRLADKVWSSLFYVQGERDEDDELYNSAGTIDTLYFI